MNTFRLSASNLTSPESFVNNNQKFYSSQYCEYTRYSTRYSRRKPINAWVHEHAEQLPVPCSIW